MKNKGFVKKVLLFFFLIMFVVSGYKIIRWYIDTSNSKNKYEKIAEEAISIKDHNMVIDFVSLKQINPDVVAWIKIEDTPINYPIVQCEDNEYYLKKNFYKEPSAVGTLFLDFRNDKNLSDKNSIVFGHNMKNGSMFASLLDINNKKFGDDVIIKVYTPEKNMFFKVFSSYTTIPDDYAINPEVTEDEYIDFIDTVRKRSEVTYANNETVNNQVLTLSTCNNTGKRRVIVHSMLDKEEKVY